MAIPQWFNVALYMRNKLAQVRADEPQAGWDGDSVNAAFIRSGFLGDEGAYRHFLDYGQDEGVSPNQYFNAAQYLSFKTALFYNTSAPSVTAEQRAFVKTAIENAGMSLWDHYNQFGSAEGVNPSNFFDNETYMLKKLAHCKAMDGSSAWTMEKLVTAFQNAGLSALEHYELYGKNENIAASRVTKDLAPEGRDQDVNPSGDKACVVVEALDRDGAADGPFEGIHFNTLNFLYNGEQKSVKISTLASYDSYEELAGALQTALDAQHPTLGISAGIGKSFMSNTHEGKGIVLYSPNADVEELEFSDIRGITESGGSTDFIHYEANIKDNAIALEIIDSRGVRYDDPLATATVRGLKFMIDGEEITLNFNSAVDSYADLCDAVQNAIDSAVPQYNLQASLGDFFNMPGAASNDGTVLNWIAGQKVVISSATPHTFTMQQGLSAFITSGTSPYSWSVYQDTTSAQLTDQSSPLSVLGVQEMDPALPPAA